MSKCCGGSYMTCAQKRSRKESESKVAAEQHTKRATRNVHEHGTKRSGKRPRDLPTRACVCLCVCVHAVREPWPWVLNSSHSGLSSRSVQHCSRFASHEAKQGTPGQDRTIWTLLCGDSTWSAKQRHRFRCPRNKRAPAAKGNQCRIWSVAWGATGDLVNRGRCERCLATTTHYQRFEGTPCTSRSVLVLSDGACLIGVLGLVVQPRLVA